MAKSPKTSSMAWVVMYSVAGIVDVVQIVIDFTGLGIFISEILEVITPIMLGVLCFIVFGIRITVTRGLVIVGGAAADAITGGLAPFWCAVVWYVKRDVVQEEARKQSTEQTGKHLNNAGIRQPSNEGQGRQLNEGGVREPSGHIVRGPTKTEDNPLAA